MFHDDLIRAGVNVADACFVFSNKSPEESSAEDIANTMRTIMIENFASGFDYDIDTFVQLLDPSIEYGEQMIQYSADVLVPLEEWKTRLLSLSALTPGFATLFDNIFCSFAR